MRGVLRGIFQFVRCDCCCCLVVVLSSSLVREGLIAAGVVYLDGFGKGLPCSLCHEEGCD